MKGLKKELIRIGKHVVVAIVFPSKEKYRRIPFQQEPAVS